MNRPRVVIYGSASADGRLTIAPGVLLMFGDKRWDSIAGSDEEIGRWLRERDTSPKRISRAVAA